MPCEKPLLSIIVPVYKVENYLQKCIDSILAQTFTDFELILVEDGSPDGCPALCDAAAAKDARIRVLHQKTAGFLLPAMPGWMWQGASGSALWIPTTILHRKCTKHCTRPCKAPGQTLPCAITLRWTRQAHPACRRTPGLHSGSLPGGNC